VWRREAKSSNPAQKERVGKKQKEKRACGHDNNDNTILHPLTLTLTLTLALALALSLTVGGSFGNKNTFALSGTKSQA
jgi:hypothetical protein